MSFKPKTSVDEDTSILVSVVIPTVGRVELASAVQSVLDQTYPIHEIFVVADTEAPIELPDDPRIRLLRVGPGAGGNLARQQGIVSATGDVIGLLDDDDEWLPSKIEVQLALVGKTAFAGDAWLGVCRVETRGLLEGETVWPDKMMRPTDNLVDYLFRKTKVKGGTGFAQSSTLIFPRTLAIRVPFDPTLMSHQDVGWLVDVAHAERNLKVFQPVAPLAIFKVTLGTGSVSQTIKYKESIAWAVKRLSPDGKRILGDFILTHTLILSRREHSLLRATSIIESGFLLGRPGIPAIGYAGVTVVKIIASKISKQSRSLVSILRGRRL